MDYVTNELRHDINAHLNSLLSQLQQVKEIYETIKSVLGISLDTSYSEWEQNIALLQTASHAPKIPVFWITEGDILFLSQEANLNKGNH